jgi:hypothetical protein
MMSIDSEATFRERVLDLGLEAHLPRFEKKKWRTLSNLVFATTYTCHVGDEQKFLDEIVTPGLGAPDHDDYSNIRRLFFEAFALCAADLRRTTEGSAADGPPVILSADRDERRKRVETRWSAFTDENGFFEDGLDISDNLIDRCIAMWRANRVAYLSLDLCTKRTLEIVNVNKDPTYAQTPDSNGFMKMRAVDDEERCRISSQFDIMHAFMRRGFGLEAGDVMDFQVHETIRRKLLASLTKEPPTGFLPVLLDQVLEADVLIWQNLSKMARGGIRRRSAVARPLDLLVPKVLALLEVQMALMPRQGVVRPAAAAASSSDQGQTNKLLAALQKQINDVANEQRRSKNVSDAFAKGGQPKASPNRDAAGPGKKGDDAAKKRERRGNRNDRRGSDPKPPAALAGCATRSNAATGRVLMCYGYNLGTCSTKGDRCAKGEHICMRKVNGEACSQKHPQMSCTAR